MNGSQRPDGEWLRELLQEEAARHEPRRERMLARIENGMAASSGDRRPRPRRRLAVLPALAVAAVIALAWWLVTPARSPAPDPAAAVRHSTPSTRPPSPEPTPTPTGPRPTTERADVEVSRRPEPTPKPGVRAKALVDPHSNPYWAQNNLVLTFAEPVRELKVTVRVARTPGVTPAGQWVALPAEDFETGVEEQRGTLVYRWVLKPGRTVWPGSHTFAVQYNRRPGDPGGRDDSYVVEVAGRRLAGHF
ncbi:hypothetical protein [Thermoactinospora rubra]|uniref:hypothetical protein n=1 Tax=Thermoactinospora rubra TaxID=1088767 RepID=UPI000A11414F|nr:hypothetical protein [Thermoactinospora rubra]